MGEKSMITCTPGSDTNPSRQWPPLVTVKRWPWLTASSAADITCSVELAGRTYWGRAWRRLLKRLFTTARYCGSSVLIGIDSECALINDPVLVPRFVGPTAVQRSRAARAPHSARDPFCLPRPPARRAEFPPTQGHRCRVSSNADAGPTTRIQGQAPHD